jgi:hypothetical protein
MKVKIKLPYNKIIKRKVRNNNELLIYGIKYRIPNNLLDILKDNRNQIGLVKYYNLEIITDFNDILIQAFENTGIGELEVQINDIDLVDIYDPRADFSLTLDYLITEAQQSLSHYSYRGNTKEQKKEISKIETYIKRFDMVSELLKINNKYQDKAILPIEGTTEYIIYPTSIQNKVIKMDKEEQLNHNEVSLELLKK